MFHRSSSTCLSPAKTQTKTKTKKMGVQHHENMNLVLSTDAKPRLKWTQELHQRFVEAVNQLGGADKATPKSLMRVMGISGLTLYHLKSHLQKYRLGKSQHSETSIENKQEVLLDAEYKEIQSTDNGNLSFQIDDGNLSPINESFKVSQAIQMQMEVQRKLHEQIEVQRHLQLRIEAQGKYLQTVLKKAQETLSGYNSSSVVGIELAKAELSQLVSMVNTGCPSSSISGLTEPEGSTLKDTERNQMQSAVCSMDSSLTSSESSGRKNETGETNKCNTPPPVELSLMDIQPWNSRSSNQGKSRDHSIISGGTRVEQPKPKRSKSGDQLREPDLYWGTFDLNRHYQYEIESSQKGIDLNCKGTEQLNGN